jgi:hypothetical protein
MCNRIAVILILAALCSGCATAETVQFRPKGQQDALVRDGQAALVSRGKNSLVLVRPASRQFASRGRPVFVVAMNNLGRGPIEFRMANVQAVQNVDGQLASLQVITYEELVNEERSRQVASAILVGLAAGANAASASRAGYYNSQSTVYTPRGTYNVSTTGYSPTANAIAQSNAAAQNEAMIASTVEQGQRNMATLERAVMKDNTLLPGEWYGGQLHLQPLASEGSQGERSYSITLMVGPDRHEINIVPAPTR